MMTQAAASLDVQTAIFERFPDSPASRLTQHNVAGGWDDTERLQAFVEMTDLITLENEFVDAGVLSRLAQMGTPVYPTADTLGKVQDKLVQKQTMHAASIPLPSFREVGTSEDVVAAAADFGWPLVLKARRDGYDGYGNATLGGEGDIPQAWDALTKGNRRLLVEAFVPFKRELAVIVVRRRSGEVITYPVVETIQQNHICHVVRAPGDVTDDVRSRAKSIARKAVEAIDGVGVFGVEMFELEDGTVLYNEIAPRPHNTGHYTIEGCVTSQFENHIRAVMDWPLGSVEMVKPAAVMVNVLGSRKGVAETSVVIPALEVPRAHIHIYGKRDIRVGRKMGHVTVVDDSIEEAESQARKAAGLVDL